LEKKWGAFFDRDFILGIAISALSFLSVVLIPLVGAMMMFMTPLPVLFYYAKLGRVRGFAVFGISLSLVLLTLNLFNPAIITPLLFFIFIGGTGMIMAEVLNRSFSIEKTLIISLTAVLTGFACLFLFYSYQAGQPPWQLIESYIINIIGENIKFYEKLDASFEQIALLKDNAGQIAELLTYVFPAAILVMAGISVCLNISAARFLFGRHGLRFPDFGDLTRWNAPEKLIWVVIIAGGLLLMPLHAVKFAGLNLLIVCLFIYLFEGVSIAAYFFKVRKVPVFFKVMFYVLIAIQQYLLIFFIALGLFNLWFDFRKFIRPAQDENM